MSDRITESKATGYQKPYEASHRVPRHQKDGEPDAKIPHREHQSQPDVPRQEHTTADLLNRGVRRMLGKLLTILISVLPSLIVFFFLVNILRAGIESVCRLPGAARVVASCAPPTAGMQQFDGMTNLHRQLLNIQEIGEHGVTLPMQLEYSKNVVREVATIVHHSNIPSRVEMVAHLTQFWQLTDRTGDEVGDFLQSIDRMIDSIITRNEVTIRNLKRIAVSRNEPVSIPSQVVAVLFRMPLNMESKVRQQYLQHLDHMKSDIDTVILQSQLLNTNLRQLANIQWGLHGLITADNQMVTEQEQEVQDRFWTWFFGANHDLLKDYHKQFAVLKGLDIQRHWAIQMVSSIALTLKELQARLGDLRVRVLEPGLDLSEDLEIQIRIIQKSIDELKAGKLGSHQAKQQTMAEIGGRIKENFN